MAEKILIVDDDPQTVKYLSIFLKRLGYDTLEALEGRFEGLNQISR